MKRIVVLLLIIFGLNGTIHAVEGMWIPSLINMFYSDMQTYGLKLSAEEVYSTNQTSLKDAIVQFNGGCTAEIVSEQGLLFTNHHCGFDAIQKHSSLEHDYLKDGFWSKSNKEELACPWLRVTFVKRIEEVTRQVLTGVESSMSADERDMLINKNIKAVQKTATTGNHYEATIKPFNLGNQYFMLVTEDFNDIRLVGAPPSAIGKFGGDTDNWVWPRHTGDFSVFRIYADKNNKSAKYSEDNQPYQPKHSLPISMKPKQQGDFAMVYGFPGSTDQHYSKAKLQFYIEKERPARIKMRQVTIDLMKPAMNSNDLIRIQYASKQARIANAWKKWIGQIKGLKELDALGVKAKWEEEYLAKAAEKNEWKKKYYPVIKQLADLQKSNQKYELARALFIEYFSVGPEFIRYAFDFYNISKNYEKLVAENKLDAEVKRLKARTKGFYKNYNKNLDRKIFSKLTPLYIESVEAELLPTDIISTWKKNEAKIFEKSILMDSLKVGVALGKYSKKWAKKITNDPALTYALSIYSAYFSNVREQYKTFSNKEKELMKTYLEGIMEMFPDKKTWPDANSTLRIAYGKIDGSSPYDGMVYEHYTTIDGIMQKFDNENPDFELPKRFVELYRKGDFGQYTQDEELWVCFTASNHTTGGNSGSPVIDAEGNLMGINFDRSWESTMSDFLFSEQRCRNITVDVRYVLWVIDKYGEAGHLINEMKLVN